MSVGQQRRTSAVRIWTRSTVRVTGILVLVAALIVGTTGQAGAEPSAPVAPAVAAAPTPPPNPSDDDINSSEQQATTAAAAVGKLSGQVSATESKISALQNDMEFKVEQVNKAIVDLSIAEDDATKAEQAATAAAARADAAGAAITVAEQQAADFAAASFRNGSTLGSMTALLGAQSPADLLQRNAMLQQVADSQLDAIAHLQQSRNAKANKDAAARAALDKAKLARKQATDAAAFAEKAKDTAAIALRGGQQQLDSLQTQLTTQQNAYADALNNTASLKEQREAYNQWLAEKKAEELRQRQAAEARARQARAEAARRAAAEKAEAAAAAKAAAQARAETAAKAKAGADARAAAAAKRQQLAAAAAAKKRQSEAAQKAAIQKAAATKKAADQAAATAKAAKQAQIQAQNAAKNSAAAKTAAQRRTAAARTEENRQTALRASATEQARVDAARTAKQQADKLKQIRGQGTGKGAYFQSCDAARTAGYGAIKKGENGYRKELDPNGNGIACDASLAEPRGQGTSSGAYYKDCDAARAAGAAPPKKGQPGYRATLDPNGNGIACDAGTSSDTSSNTATSSGPASSTGGSSVPNDGSKGSIVVNAALRYLGTPYSWGGGNSSGPTTGISAGCSSTCMRYEPWNTVGFDCSGLTLYAWAQVGVSLPHYSVYQFLSGGQRLSRSELQAGDLVFFANNTSDPNTIHHVGIYMGNGQLIEAPQSGTPVRIRGWRDDGYIGAIRPGT